MNFNSMLKCDVINGILMQANAMWDQASVCVCVCVCVCEAMFCCDIVMYQGMDFVALISHVL